MRRILAVLAIATTAFVGTGVAAQAVPANVKIPTAKPAPVPCTCGPSLI